MGLKKKGPGFSVLSIHVYPCHFNRVRFCLLLQIWSDDCISSSVNHFFLLPYKNSFFSARSGTSLIRLDANTNWIKVPQKQNGTSKNYTFNLVFFLPCSKTEFTRNILCVNGPVFLGGEICNPVTDMPRATQMATLKIMLFVSVWFLCIIISIQSFRIRAIVQAVSRWLPTSAARVRSRVWSSGICGG
jgi:hypothetical protein